jgi:hypothetical protein
MRFHFQLFGGLAMALLGCETRPPPVEAPSASSCVPLPEDGAPCSGGLCAIADEPDSYLQCIGGSWVKITEQPLEQEPSR